LYILTTQRLVQLTQLLANSVGIPTRVLDIPECRFDVFTRCIEFASRGLEITHRGLGFFSSSLSLLTRGLGLLSRCVCVTSCGVELKLSLVDLLLAFVTLTLRVVDAPLHIVAHLIESTLQIFDVGGQPGALLIGRARGGLANVSDLAIRILTHRGLRALGRLSGKARRRFLKIGFDLSAKRVEYPTYSLANLVVERRHVFRHYTT
jgi:hypothetical protein